MARSNFTSGPAAHAADATARVDADLVASAYRKVMNRQELTRSERAALKRHEKEKEERLRWQYYRSIPQRHWRQMSGRQTKVLNEQAERYGIPFGGPTIDLGAVVRALHDFLAENAQRLARENDDLMQGSGSPALEEYRQERAKIARLDRLAREQQLLPRSEVREALVQVATLLRETAEELQRRYGPAAAEIVHDALDDAEREIDRMFAGFDGTASQPRQKQRADDEAAVLTRDAPDAR